MAAYADAVDRHLAFPVAGIYMQQHAAAGYAPRGGNIDLPALPYRVAEVNFAYAGQPAFHAERNGYLTRQAVGVRQAAFAARAGRIGVELPAAVEAQPLGAVKLWPWIF